MSAKNVARIEITWTPNAGVAFRVQGMDLMDTLSVLRVCEHAVLKQVVGSSAVGRPPDPEAPPSGSLRTPGFAPRTVDRGP